MVSYFPIGFLIYTTSGAALVRGPGCGAAEPALAPRLEVAGTYGGSTAFHSVDCNGPRMFGRIWRLLRFSVQAFIADDALSRGASISFIPYLDPSCVVHSRRHRRSCLRRGRGARRDREPAQRLMGRASADLVQTALQSASGKSSGILASVVGATTLLITASGVFGEMQSALNAIWKAQPQGTTVSRLLRARATSLGLVAALGFPLLVSLVISAILSGFSSYVSAVLPFGALILQILNFVISFALISVLFAAIYKVLPDAKLSRADGLVGRWLPRCYSTWGSF